MSDGDDFQWLYTRRVKAQPPKPPTTPPQGTPAQGNDAEHTQVLPVQPGIEQTAERPAATYVPPTNAAPPIIAPLPKGALPGSQRPKIKRPIKLVLLSILAIVAVWAGLLVWAGLSVLDAAPRVNYAPPGGRPADQPGSTYLLVGSDSRTGLTPAEELKYSTGGAAGQPHTDTIMLVHTGSNGTIVMSIPRDSIVSVPDAPSIQEYGSSRCFNPKSGQYCTKINAAFGDGAPGRDPSKDHKAHDLDAQALVKTIEQATGIRIDGYLEIGLGGLPKMVDSVGGITICPDAKALLPGLTEMTDTDSGAATADNGHPIKMVCQHANGLKALAFARDRHDFSAGDFQRAADQREVMAAVMHKLQGLSFILNPFRLHNAGTKVMSTISLGNGMSIWQLYNLFGALKDLSAKKAKSCLVPLSDASGTWSQDRAPKMFDLIKSDQITKIGPSLCTTTGMAP